MIRRPRGLVMATDLGLTPVGRLIDVRADQVGGQWMISWDVELLDGIDDGSTAVYVYHDGDFVQRVVGEKFYWFVPLSDSVSDQIELFLGPSGGIWEHGFDAWQSYDRALLQWDLDGDAYRVRVRGNYGASISGSDPLAVLSTVSASIPDPFALTTNVAYASGVWSLGGVQYDTITLEITSGGYADEALYEWTWGSVTGSGVCRTYPEHAVNGVRVWFDGNTEYQAGDTWEIRVGLPTDYTTKKWTLTGDHTFRIDTANAAGSVTAGDAVTKQINPPPKRPSYYSNTTYVDGTGQIAVTWSVGDDDAASWRVYQSRPWTDERDTHWAWTDSGTSFSSNRFTSGTLALQSGRNRITATTLDASGQESGESDVFEITLDDSLNQIIAPNPPYSMTAEMQSNGNILVTVWVDSTATHVRVYHDAHDGSIDYTTLIVSAANTDTTEMNEVTLTISSGLTDGRYLIGARSVRNGVEEENDDMIAEVYRITAASEKASGLTVDVVH